jgi:hypothetical protein
MPFGFKLVGVRSKYRFTVLVFTVNEALLGLLSIYVSPLFMVAAVIVVLGCGTYAMRIRCHTCGKPVLYDVVNNLGIKMYAYIPTVPEKCSRCDTLIS